MVYRVFTGLRLMFRLFGHPVFPANASRRPRSWSSSVH